MVVLLLTTKSRYQAVEELIFKLKLKEFQMKETILETITIVEMTALSLHKIVIYFKDIFEMPLLLLIAHGFQTSLYVSLFVSFYGTAVISCSWLIFYMVSNYY